MNRLTIMKFHALLAAFILPVAVMYIVTGAFYTWGVKGDYAKEVYEISLTSPLVADTGELSALAESELQKLNIASPEGKPKLKQYGNYFFLEWTGSSKDILLEPGDDQLAARLTVKDTSWYRTLVQLHKAKGGEAFKYYAVILATSIGLLLISGFVMAWQTPKLRSATMAASVLGILSFAAFIWMS